MSEQMLSKDQRDQRDQRHTGKGSQRLPSQIAEMALKDFYHKYPQLFKGGRLRQFAPVYYPIATLDLELLEQAGEEFDTIEHTVLLLVRAGLRQPEQICDVMGLPVNYTNRILEVLHGYGHIQESSLTELGILSAETGVNYKQYLIRQKVQADSIRGSLVPREMIQPASSLVRPTQTRLPYPMIRPNAHLSVDTLQQLEQVIERYKARGDESIFNVNVEKVTQILETKVEYTHGFLVEFDHLPHPFVILKCRERVNKETRYDWKPTALAQEAWEAFGHPFTGMEGIDNISLQPLLQLAADLEHALQEELGREGFKRRLGQQTIKHFGQEGSYEFDGCALHIYMDDQMLGPFSWELLQSIEAVAYCGQGLPHLIQMKNDLLPSLVCYIHTDNPSLVTLSEAIGQLKTSHPRLPLYRSIKSQLGDESEIVTVDRLLAIVEQLRHAADNDSDSEGRIPAASVVTSVS